MREEFEKTISYYDREAESYAKFWKESESVTEVLKEFSASIPSPNGCILDIGAGHARDWKLLKDSGLDLIGVDLSTRMLEIARTSMPLGVFRHADIMKLPFPANLFEGVWSVGCLHHIPPRLLHEAIASISRVSKSNGVACISVHSEEYADNIDDLGRHIFFHDLPSLRNAFEKYGWRIKKTSFQVSSKARPGRQPTRWMTVIAAKSNYNDRGMAGCHLCEQNRFRLNYEHGLKGASSVLWGDEDFYVAADIAPVLPGHVLIVSNPHVLGFAHLNRSKRAKLGVLVEKTRNLLRQVFGMPVLVTEHCPSNHNQSGGCIDHAHIHLIPTQESLESILELELDLMPDLIETSELELADWATRGLGYFAIYESEKRVLAAKSPILPNQFSRRLFFRLEEDANHWRWQTAIKLKTNRRFLDETVLRCTEGLDSNPNYFH